MSDDRYERGMAVRREVLGDAHVDAALAAASDAHRRLPGADHPLRLGRDLGAAGPRPAHPQLHHADGARRRRPPHELALHLRAARRNGLTWDEIKEVLLQTAIYCGVPAANSAFAVAQRVYQEEAGA